MFTLIASVLGIIGTILAWNLNPRRKLYAELDDIYRQLENLYVLRDKALKNNDSDLLTVATGSIVELCQRKAVLFQRFSKGI